MFAFGAGRGGDTQTWAHSPQSRPSSAQELKSSHTALLACPSFTQQLWKPRVPGGTGLGTASYIPVLTAGAELSTADCVVGGRARGISLRRTNGGVE